MKTGSTIVSTPGRASGSGSVQVLGKGPLSRSLRSVELNLIPPIMSSMTRASLQLDQPRRVFQHATKALLEVGGLVHVVGQAVHLVDEAHVADEVPFEGLPLGGQGPLPAAHDEEEGEAPACPRGLVALAHLLEHLLA
ncbi:unnamed protein product [Clonostachys solani]|uniref:Uncharacterized protein n=1 Tax=Clonostachys solani TaxID=160281 RepID=A0A9N9YZD5_9HYPO|nr:unnamed protein product [Clonostachys solani]